MLVGKRSKAANCVSFKANAAAGTGHCTLFLKEAASRLKVEVAEITSFKGSRKGVAECKRGDDKTFATSANDGLHAVVYEVCATASKTPIAATTTSATTRVTTPKKTTSKCQPPISGG